MNISDDIELKIKDYCSEKIPEHIKDKLKVSYAIERNSITINEERPLWNDPSKWSITPIAKFSLIKGKWTLFCQFRDLKWHKYKPLGANKNIGVLLQELDKDPTGIFWG